MVQDSNEMAEELRKTLLSFKEALENGDSNKVNQLAEHLEYLKIQIAQSDPIFSFITRYGGNSESETINNIVNGVLERINSNDELKQFIYKELDLAYKANNDYGVGKNTRNFAINTKISTSLFLGKSSQQSYIDRDDGPRKILTQAIKVFFSQTTQKMVASRIQVVSIIIQKGKEKGLFASPTRYVDRSHDSTGSSSSQKSSTSHEETKSRDLFIAVTFVIALIVAVFFAVITKNPLIGFGVFYIVFFIGVFIISMVFGYLDRNNNSHL